MSHTLSSEPHRPALSFWQIWNMSFGFFGIQFGWGLQMANMSAIYQYLGADPEDIPLLWMAAPVTGLLVQPIIGYYSDRTWTRLGRRRPYFLFGAIFASLALIAMPNSPTLWVAAGLLWILDASVNVSMEPFRAFVGDLLPPAQRKLGFSMQSLLIGLGAVLASALPWLLTNAFGMESDAGDSRIPANVHVAFYVGAVLFFFAVLYTILTTKEYPPEGDTPSPRAGPFTAFKEIFEGIRRMPPTMGRLAIPQSFTWFGLFCMWLYFAPAVSETFYDATPGSAGYREGIEWAGVCFSTYNGTAFAFAFLLLVLVRRFTAKAIHTVCLILGGLAFLTIPLAPSPVWLLGNMVGIGVAWASILAMPYAMLANGIPNTQMGFYMGVFNFFIVLPQIVASALLGLVVRHFTGGESLPVLLLGGAALLLAALTLQRVRDPGDPGVIEGPSADHGGLSVT